MWPGASLLNTEEQEKLKATDYNLCLGSRIICYCKNVTDAEILDHIVNRQCCHNLKDIQEHTGANTGHECLIKNPAGT